MPSATYNTLSGSSCAHETSGIMAVRGVSAMSVKYAAKTTATNVRKPTMASLGFVDSEPNPRIVTREVSVEHASFTRHGDHFVTSGTCFAALRFVTFGHAQPSCHAFPLPGRCLCHQRPDARASANPWRRAA